MVKNFNKFYKSRSKERSSKSRSYNDKRSSSRERNCYNCGRPGHYSNECSAPYKKREESPPRERRSRYDRYERRTSHRSKDSDRKKKSSRSYKNEDIKLMLVNGYPDLTPTTTPREVITPILNILKMKVLPDVAWSYIGISPKRKRWCSTVTVSISLSYETKFVNPVGEPSNTMQMVPTHKQQILATQRVRGVVNSSSVKRYIKWYVFG